MFQRKMHEIGKCCDSTTPGKLRFSRGFGFISYNENAGQNATKTPIRICRAEAVRSILSSCFPGRGV